MSTLPNQTSFPDTDKSGDETLQADYAGREPANEIQNPYFISENKTSAPRSRIPEWLNHFHAKDLKKLFRCSLSMWIMTIFIYIDPIQNEMGQASFLGCIALWLAPPSGTVFMHLIAAVTVLLGLTSAWAWGVITMKAALATRPEADKQARLAELQKLATSQNATDPNTFTEIQVLNGFMLDTRVTVTYFCMMCLYLYLTARLRVAAPKLRLTQMMGCIVSTVFLTEAPLLPNFDGNVAKPLVLPCAIAEGIALVCSIFVFPTSSTSEALDIMRDLLAPMPAFLDACVLGLKHPSRNMNIALLTNTRANLLTKYKQLDPVTTFLPLDFSIGRWNSDDFSTLARPLRQLIIEFAGLVEIHRETEARKAKVKKARDMARVNGEAGAGAGHKTGLHQRSREFDFHAKTCSPTRAERAEKGLQELADPAGYLIEACKESLEAVAEALTRSTDLKGSAGHGDRVERHVSTLQNLSEKRDEFNSSTSNYLAAPPHQIFDNEGLLQVDAGAVPSLTGLLRGLLIKERLSHIVDALETILSRVVELEKNRPNLRLWLPTRLASLFSWISRVDAPEDMPAADIGDTVITRISTVGPTYEYSSEKSDVNAGIKSSRAELTSMRKPNSRRRNRSGQLLLQVANWMGNSEGIFAIKMVIISVALSIPAVVHSSAGFYYREKGLWAVIMAQLTLLPYTADVVYGSIVRGAGTIIGGVAGMTAWYVGAGNGPGSPYGEAASMAVVIVLFMWWRLFTSAALMPAGIMMGITAYLVSIYSWIDTHEELYGNPGKGYEVFWRRVVLVFIGLGGTIVMTFVPKPPSANKHYRRLLSDSLISARDQYALFVSNWRDPAPDLCDVVEEEALAVAEVLLSISGPIKLTVFEFSSSNIDTETLSEVCQLCMFTNQAVAQMLIYTTRLSEKQRQWIIPATGAAEEDLIAEIMAVITVVQQALKTGDPLPAVLPTPLFARASKFAREHLERGMRESGLHHKDDVDDESSRKYAVIFNGFLQMLVALDELVLVLKRVVGETSNITVLETV